MKCAGESCTVTLPTWPTDWIAIAWEPRRWAEYCSQECAHKAACPPYNAAEQRLREAS